MSRKMTNSSHSRVNRSADILRERNEIMDAVIEEKVTFVVLADMAQDLGVDDLAEQHDHYLYRIDKI